MLKQTLFVAALALGPAMAAHAYQTGELTCDNIGQLAGQTLVAKQSGIPQDVYLSALSQRMPADAQLERKLVAAITAIIYQNDLLTGMKPADAYAVFQQDCIQSQAQDSGNDNPGATDDDDGAPETATGELRS